MRPLLHLPSIVLGILLLTARPGWCEAQRVIFLTTPPGADINLVTSTGLVTVGRSGEPFMFDIKKYAKSTGRIVVRFELEGFYTREESIPAYYFTAYRTTYPSEGMIRLSARSPLVEMRYMVVQYPLQASLVGLFSTLLMVGAVIWIRRLLPGQQARKSDATIVGGYRLGRCLGVGGTGSVYLGVSENGRETVAVKLMHPELLREGDYRKRFQRELDIGLKLDHPNLIRFLSGGITPASAWLVMEYVEGETVATLVERSGSFPVETGLSILISVADAIFYAHRIGIVHRDLKPGNIIVRPDGTVKMADFGIARGDEVARVTRTGQTLGTPEYMAPEQFDGRFPIDARSDQYGLAVTAYVILCAQLPFPQTNQPAVIHIQKLTMTPRSMTELQPDIPTELSDVFLKMLSPDPNERYESLEEPLHIMRALKRKL